MVISEYFCLSACIHFLPNNRYSYNCLCLFVDVIICLGVFFISLYLLVNIVLLLVTILEIVYVYWWIFFCVGSYAWIFCVSWWTSFPILVISNGFVFFAFFVESDYSWQLLFSPWWMSFCILLSIHHCWILFCVLVNVLEYLCVSLRSVN